MPAVDLKLYHQVERERDIYKRILDDLNHVGALDDRPDDSGKQKDTKERARKLVEEDGNG
jgi:hypothetical protein